MDKLSGENLVHPEQCSDWVRIMSKVRLRTRERVRFRFFVRLGLEPCSGLEKMNLIGIWLNAS